MTIEKNSRQVPKTREICSNKKYYDILYAYLQCISQVQVGTKVRFFSKKEINYSQLAKVFNLSRQTVSTKFKNLKDLGMIKELDQNNYQIIELVNNTAFLVPYKTLKVLTDALSENAISVYIYLINKYWQNNSKGFQFTLTEIKTQIGICDSTRSNDDIITNILFILQKIGLINYELDTCKQDDGFQNIKTIYFLNWVTNKLPEV